MSAHDTHAESTTFGTDTKAAFTGFFLGAIVLLFIVYGIVKWTNAKYSHEKTPAAATK